MGAASQQVRRSRVVWAAVAAGLSLFLPGLEAATATWVSATSGDWSDGSRWSTGQAPNDPAIPVVFPASSATYSVQISDSVAVKTLAASNSPAFTLDIGSGAELTMAGNLNLGSSTLSLSDGGLWLSPTSAGAITATVTSMIGAGEITLDGLGPSTLAGSLSTLTLPAGVAVRTGSQGGAVTCATVAGTISAESFGQSISLSVSGAVTGMLQASHGASLILTSTAALSGSASSLTVPSGNWTVSDNSSITFSNASARITKLGADAMISLIGPGSSFPALERLATNAGTFLLDDARTFATYSNFTNTGAITLGAASILKVKGGLTNSGTLSLAGGTLLIDYTGASPLASLRADLAAGRISTPFQGAYVGYAEASRLGVNSWVGQTIDSTTLITFLTSVGDTNLDGSINGDDYVAVDRGFARHLGTWADGDFNYDGKVDDEDYLLIDTVFAEQGDFSPSLMAQRQAQFGETYLARLLVQVPEPQAFSALFLLAMVGARRRKK